MLIESVRQTGIPVRKLERAQGQFWTAGVRTHDPLDDAVFFVLCYSDIYYIFLVL